MRRNPREFWYCMKCNYYTLNAARLKQHDDVKHKPYGDPIVRTLDLESGRLIPFSPPDC